jgi:hypothetical protein
MLPVFSAVDNGPLNAVLIRHCQALNRTRRSSSSENHQGRATSLSVLYTCKLNTCVSLFISSPLPACALGIGCSAAPPSPPFVPQNFPPSTSCLVLLPPVLSAICTAHILHSRHPTSCPLSCSSHCRLGARVWPVRGPGSLFCVCHLWELKAGGSGACCPGVAAGGPLAEESCRSRLKGSSRKEASCRAGDLALPHSGLH